MAGTAVKDLQGELFLDGSGLKELLQNSTRPRLHPAVSAFIERVGTILEKTETPEQIPNQHIAVSVVPAIVNKIGTEPPQHPTKSGRILAFMYDHPGCGTKELTAHVGGRMNQLTAAVSRLRNSGLVERNSYSLTAAGAESVQQLAATTLSAKAHAQIAEERLPRDVAFSYLLEPSISGLPRQQQEKIVKYALRILGERTDGRYKYGRLRAFEIFTGMVRKNNGVPASLFREISRVVASDEAVFNTFARLQKLYGLSGPPVTHNKPPITRPVEPSKPIYTAPNPAPNAGAPQSAEHYLSRLRANTQKLGRSEQEVVRSYALRLAGNNQPEQLKAVGALADFMARLTALGGLSAELYEAFCDPNVSGSVANEFNSQLCSAKDACGVLAALSKVIPARYAQRVSSMADIYNEDVDMVPVLKGRGGFHTATISARNQIPVLRAGHFYETIKRIPNDKHWGNRYSDLIRLVAVSPVKAVGFVEWASAQRAMDGTKFDLGLGKYIAVRTRSY